MFLLHSRVILSQFACMSFEGHAVSVEQLTPPYWAGVATIRVLVCSPPLHVEVHVVQSAEDHSDHEQSTLKDGKH